MIQWAALADGARRIVPRARRRRRGPRAAPGPPSPCWCTTTTRRSRASSAGWAFASSGTPPSTRSTRTARRSAGSPSPLPTAARTCCWRRASSDVERAAVGRQGGGRVFGFLETDDFDRDHARFLAAEVEFTEAPRHEPYGTVAVFLDPCGNPWDLIGPRPRASPR